MMASIDSSLREVEDITICPLCLEFMTDPRILPCIHTFCSSCLVMYGEQQSLINGELHCPVCRGTFGSVDFDFSRLPKNTFVEKLIEAKLSGSEPGVKFCDVCVKLDEKCHRLVAAETFCLECQECLCSQCTQMHRTMKMSRAHRLRSAQNCSSVQECLKSSISYCDQHPNKEIEIYCTACQTVCCMMCCIQDHHHHKCCDVNKFADEFKRRLSGTVDKIEKINVVVRKQIDKVQSITAEYVANVYETETEIRQRCEAIKSIVEKHRDTLLFNLQARTQRQVNLYERNEESLRVKATSLTYFKKYSTEVIDKALPTDIARLANEFNIRMAELEDLKVDDFENQARVEFNPADFEPKNKINKFMNLDRNWNVVGALTYFPSKTSSCSISCQGIPSLMKYLKLGFIAQCVTVVRNEIFVVPQDNSQSVHVFGADSHAHLRTFRILGLINPYDMVSYQDMLFISSYSKVSNALVNGRIFQQFARAGHVQNTEISSNSVTKIHLSGSVVSNWTVDDPQRRCAPGNGPAIDQIGLTITKTGNVLVCCVAESKIKEYTTVRELVREINVDPSYSKAARYVGNIARNRIMPSRPSRAFQLSNGLYLFHHSRQNTVYMINNQGKIMQTCNRNISDVQVDKIDQFYAIDIDSDRIVRIGSSLDVDTVVLPKLSTISRLSPKILLDEIENKLYIYADGITILQFKE